MRTTRGPRYAGYPNAVFVIPTTRGPRNSGYHAIAGYPNAAVCDSCTHVLHTDPYRIAVCNHTRTTFPRATRMRMRTTRGPRINMYHANAGYPNAAVCDSALACYIPTFAGCSM